MFRAVQSVGRCERSLITAEVPGFFRHGLTKGFHGTANMFSDGYGSVVIRFQHEGIEKIGEKKLTALPGAQMYFGGGGGCFGKGNHIIKISVFQCVKAGHDFGGAGHGKLCFFFLAKKNTLIFSVQENGCFGIKTGRSFRSQRIYGMIGAEKEQKKEA